MKLIGKVRLIECDAIRYPSHRDVVNAIRNKEANISAWIKNVVPLVGQVAIVRRLANTNLKANEGVITYGAIGPGTNTPSVSDTSLQTESFRKTIATAEYLSNVLTVQLFLSTSEGNMTIREYGLFGEDASSTASSGTLFERVSMNKTKTSAKTLTIETSITVA